MARKSLEGLAADIANLGSVDGIPFACKKNKAGEFSCRRVGTRPTSGGKGTKFVYIKSEIVSPKRKDRLAYPSPEQNRVRHEFSQAAQSCAGQGPNFKSCMQKQLGTSKGKKSSYRSQAVSRVRDYAPPPLSEKAKAGAAAYRACMKSKCAGLKGDARKNCSNSKCKKKK